MSGYNILETEEKSLLNYIESFKSDHVSKKKRGVVFTNNTLINKLLDTIPKEVWKNKRLKWLDPGSGIGNIMIHIFYRLMKSIPIKSVEKRRKHILENMLYFIEIKTHYISIIEDIFCHNDYNLNIHNGSYVLMNTDNDNNNLYENDILFDIIVTNPPYQKPSKDGGISAKPLYHLFIQKSLELLKEGGYLVAIHPFTWRRKSREIKLIDELMKYQISYLYTNNNFQEFDKSAIHINYYILEKVPIYKKTICDNYFNNKYYRSELLLKNDCEYLPILLTEETLNIINKLKNINDDKFNIKLESKLSSTHSKANTSSTKNDIYMYKNFHTYSLKKQENIYKYTKEKHPSHDKLKIIMNFKGGYNIFKPFIDYGTMGITDNALYMEVKDKEQGLKILKIFQSKLFIFILMITSYNYAPNKKIEFHILNTLSISDEYELLPTEKHYIEEIVK
jgi:tRNA1(Val) A37 N6-methylase TrmN6